MFDSSLKPAGATRRYGFHMDIFRPIRSNLTVAGKLTPICYVRHVLLDAGRCGTIFYMDKYFNIAGPCFPNRHYMLPALDRMPEIRRLVDQEMYFVIHAPRQTGKTTAVKALAREINAKGEKVV